MKALLREYLASLKERSELDAILPDLLSELGYTVYSRPQRGTAQHGVDVAAVGKDEDGERKVFLFSVKQGDLTRQDWDNATPQALRRSLNQILDSYIPNRIPARFQTLKVVICLVFGGDMQEQVRDDVTGYTKQNSNERISFDEWNGDRLAGLLMQGILREEILPKELRSHFQKAVAMVDEPDIAYQHFAVLVRKLSERATAPKARIRAARQIYICLWILYVWARDAGNLDAPHRASELALLYLWTLLRPDLGGRNGTAKALTTVLLQIVQLNLGMAHEFLERKVLRYADKRHALSFAVGSRASLDVNLRLFDMLGRIGTTGIWVYWMVGRDTDTERRKSMQAQLGTLVGQSFAFIGNNPSLFLPIADQLAIDICAFLMMAVHSLDHRGDMLGWLQVMTAQLDYTLKAHGRYPCTLTEYSDLLVHPKERSDEYRKEVTAGSILIPLLAAWLAAFKDTPSVQKLAALKDGVLAHCTMQWWMPDETSEERLYVGNRDHGIAIAELPLTDTGVDLLETLKEASDRPGGFSALSAVTYGFWPVVVTACRHYRLPPPPQIWIGWLLPPAPEAAATTASGPQSAPTGEKRE